MFLTPIFLHQLLTASKDRAIWSTCQTWDPMALGLQTHPNRVRLGKQFQCINLCKSLHFSWDLLDLIGTCVIWLCHKLPRSCSQGLHGARGRHSLYPVSAHKRLCEQSTSQPACWQAHREGPLQNDQNASLWKLWNANDDNDVNLTSKPSDCLDHCHFVSWQAWSAYSPAIGCEDLAEPQHAERHRSLNALNAFNDCTISSHIILGKHECTYQQLPNIKLFYVVLVCRLYMTYLWTPRFSSASLWPGSELRDGKIWATKTIQEGCHAQARGSNSKDAWPKTPRGATHSQRRVFWCVASHAILTILSTCSNIVQSFFILFQQNLSTQGLSGISGWQWHLSSPHRSFQAYPVQGLPSWGIHGMTLACNQSAWVKLPSLLCWLKHIETVWWDCHAHVLNCFELLYTTHCVWGYCAVHYSSTDKSQKCCRQMRAQIL